MKVREFAFLALRVVAAFVFIRGLEYITGINEESLSSLSQTADQGQISMSTVSILSLLPSLLVIAISLLLWWKAGFAVSLMIGARGAEAKDWSDVTTNSLYRLGFILLGIVLLIVTIPELFSSIGQLSDASEVTQPFLLTPWTDIIIYVVKLVVALSLILHTKVVFAWIQRTIQQAKASN